MSISGLGASSYPGMYAQQLLSKKDHEDKISELQYRSPVNDDDHKKPSQPDAFAEALNNALQPVQVVAGPDAVQLSNVTSNLNAATEDSGQTVENINGIRVIVGRHAFDNGSGWSLFRTVGADEAEAFWASSRQFVQDDNVTPGMEVISSEPTSIPEGAVAIMNVNMHVMATGWSWDVSALAMNIESYDNEYAERVQDYMNVVGVERDLKARYGDDIKLVYSHLDSSYIMLTPDDSHYGEMASAEDAVQYIFEDVRNHTVSAASVRDALAPYGYQV